LFRGAFCAVAGKATLPRCVSVKFFYLLFFFATTTNFEKFHSNNGRYTAKTVYRPNTA